MRIWLHKKYIHGQEVWLVDHRYMYDDGTFTVWNRRYYDTWPQAHRNMLAELKEWHWQAIESGTTATIRFDG